MRFLEINIFRGEKHTKQWVFFWIFIILFSIFYINKDFFKPILLSENNIVINGNIKENVKVTKKNGTIEIRFNQFNDDDFIEISQKKIFSLSKINIESEGLDVFKNGNNLMDGEQSNFQSIFSLWKNTKILINNSDNHKINQPGSIKILFITFNNQGIVATLIASLFWIFVFLLAYKKNQASLVIAIFSIFCLSLYAEKITFNQLPQISSMFSIGVLLSFFLFLLVFLNNYAKKVNKNKYFLFFTGFIFIFLAAIPVALISYYLSFGVGLGGEAVHVIMQTNHKEAIEYFLDFISYKSILFFLFSFFFLFYISFWHRASKVKSSNSKIVVFFIVISFVSSFIYAKEIRLAFVFLNAYNEYIDELNQFKELQSKRKKNPIVAEKKYSGETYIVIIGESHNKNHMQIYGYPRKTTPKLQQLLNNEYIVILNNVYSNHTHTMPTLSLALTEANQYNQKTYFESASIVEVLSAAGFETVWLTNQNLLGAWDNMVAIVANQADKFVGINKSIGKITKTQMHDGALIPLIEKELNQKTANNKVIFIHLMGSHSSYCSRFPAEFAIFKDNLKKSVFDKHVSQDQGLKELVNCYDNSVLYNDFVVSSIIDLIKNKKSVSALLYISDHADDVFGRLGHNSGNFTFEMTQIPMFLYFSDEYKERYLNTYNGLLANKDKLFSNDMLYDTLLGLTNISTSAYDSKYDLTSSEYVLNDEDAKTLHGEKNYADPGNSFYWQQK